jgi:hypothetical protein
VNESDSGAKVSIALPRPRPIVAAKPVHVRPLYSAKANTRHTEIAGARTKWLQFRRELSQSSSSAEAQEGLAAAKALLDEGLAPLLLEASEDIGGQWNTTASHSGVWPGMATNTSKTTPVFSDLAHNEETPMFPSALQIGTYLHRCADTFALNERVRTGAHVEHIERQHENGFRVHYQDRSGQHIAEASAVVVASGRHNKPKSPRQIDGLDRFSGRGGVIHAFDYPGSAAVKPLLESDPT